MTIAENTESEELIRQNFKQLRDLQQQLIKIAEEKSYDNFQLKHLSMGMSSDYKIALEEGATMLRLGSTIFGKRD